MKSKIEHEKFNTKLESSDWRASAALLSMIEFFKFHNINYEAEDKEDYILYNSEDITEERYLDFVENKYGNEFHHRVIESKLNQETISDEDIKLINDKLVANTIMKKVFNKIKFDKGNKEEILKIMEDNRKIIIKETFRSKKNMYANYANTNQLFADEQGYCRLLGYCIDAGKKGKSTGYNFTINTFVSNDMKEYDFVPFSFLGVREFFFINDNYNNRMLKQTYNQFKKNVVKSVDKNNGRLNSRQALFKGIMDSAKFINRDVEIIFKDIEKGYFETLYLRKDCIDIFKELSEKEIDYKSFCTSYKVTDKYYRNIQKEVTECILNKRYLDELIELYLKVDNSYLVTQFIKVNLIMKGAWAMEEKLKNKEGMPEKLKGAFACGKQVAVKLEENKIKSYREKLTSAIIFKDYDRVCQILLQLSNYANIEFGFVYPLYDDFEKNKELAYTFINALSKNNNKKEDK